MLFGPAGREADSSWTLLQTLLDGALARHRGAEETQGRLGDALRKARGKLDVARDEVAAAQAAVEEAAARAQAATGETDGAFAPGDHHVPGTDDDGSAAKRMPIVWPGGSGDGGGGGPRSGPSHRLEVAGRREELASNRVTAAEEAIAAQLDRIAALGVARRDAVLAVSMDGVEEMNGDIRTSKYTQLHTTHSPPSFLPRATRRSSGDDLLQSLCIPHRRIGALCHYCSARWRIWRLLAPARKQWMTLMAATLLRQLANWHWHRCVASRGV